MASIYNRDGSVGFSKQANKWEGGANPDSRYSLYSTFYNYEFSDRGDGTYTYSRSRKVQPSRLSDNDINALDKSFLQSSTINYKVIFFSNTINYFVYTCIFFFCHRNNS